MLVFGAAAVASVPPRVRRGVAAGEEAIVRGRDWVSESSAYVAAPAPADAWRTEAAQQGGVGTQRLVEVAELLPSPEVAQALRLGAGATVVVRRRVMLLDGRPVALTDSYYPSSLARGTGLARREKIRGGAVGLLAELGHRPYQAVEDVLARRPTNEERSALDLAADEWVLVLRRLSTTEDDVPVEYSVMTMTAEGRHLRYELPIS